MKAIKISISLNVRTQTNKGSSGSKNKKNFSIWQSQHNFEVEAVAFFGRTHYNDSAKKALQISKTLFNKATHVGLTKQFHLTR